MAAAASAVVWLGIALLFHAGFSAVHYKELASLAGMDLGNDFITMDVVLETMLGIAVAVAGALWNAGAFQPIDGSHQFNRVQWSEWWDEGNFRIYNHRGKALRARLSKGE